MTLLSSLICLVCSFVTCAHMCAGAPVLTCRADRRCSLSSPLQVNLALGSVLGTNTAYGSQRFTLPYAQPPVGELRFAAPQPLTALPNRTAAYDASQLPKACMQQPDSRYGIAADNVSEDCLYLNVFRPKPSTEGPLPVLVWVHGGSFIAGSSTAPGLDASYLAAQNNVVVVTIQYRLGMFGFFAPEQLTDESQVGPGAKLSGNQGVRDAIQALKFVHDNIGAFGGDASSVTLAGQSSGAHLIRTLLSTPSATSLFHKAILHSDPANFGTQTASTSDAVSRYAMGQTSCSDVACLRAMSAGDVLDASMQTVQAAQSIDDAVAVSEVWRPFVGQLTGTPFEANPAAVASKPIIVTNVENEAGSVIGNLLLPTGMNYDTAEMRAWPMSLSRQQLLGQMFNGGRADVLDSTTQYSMATNVSAYPAPVQVKLYSSAQDGLRRNLETVLTQGMFTCAAWNNARRYAAAGQVYVGLFERGITYPTNEGNDYCAQDKVCHEDDIRLVFADPSQVDESKRAVVQEVQARWVAFMRSGNPNTANYAAWQTVSTSSQSAHVLRLGSADASGAASTLDTISLQANQYAGCGQVWGSTAKFDWQLYG